MIITKVYDLFWDQYFKTLIFFGLYVTWQKCHIFERFSLIQNSLQKLLIHFAN